MKGIDPKWAMYLGLLVTIEQAIGHGTVSLTNLVPESWAPYITSWCNFGAFVGTAIMTYQAAVSSPVPGPAANTAISPTAVVRILLIAFALSAFLAVPSAHAQIKLKPLTDPFAKAKQDLQTATGVKPTGDVPFDLLKALDKALLPDLKYAQRLAVATGSKVTAPCYQAWIDMIQTQQTAVTDPPVAPATEGSPTPEPDPDLVTKFERMVELRNALQPDSPFMTACSPVANMVKMDVTAFMGIVISGGAGLATLVPGL